MKTSRIITYLTFNGNCRQAMEFYQQCLGGELYFQTLGEEVRSDELSPSMNRFILQATLQNENIVLLGTDMVAEEGLRRGNNISIYLHCETEDQVRTAYRKLKSGGRTDYPVRKTKNGSVFGGLTDRYGLHWLFQSDAVCEI